MDGKARFAGYSAAEYDRAFDVLQVPAGSELDRGAIGKRVRAGRTIRTPNFRVAGGKVHYLGAERYGVWLTISSLLLWVALTDFGLAGNALVDVLSEAVGNDDRASSWDCRLIRPGAARRERAASRAGMRRAILSVLRADAG